MTEWPTKACPSGPLKQIKSPVNAGLFCNDSGLFKIRVVFHCVIGLVSDPMQIGNGRF